MTRPNNQEIVRIALTKGGPMTWTKIGEWVRASGLRQEWTPGMNGGAIRALKDKGEIEKTGGLFRVVASSELSAAEFGASSYEPSRKPSERPAAGDHVALIPCYGLNWDRNQIEWDRKPQLLGSPRDDNSTKVNFAGQFGVYVLYEWPNVTYAGRTTEGHLYDRLLRHTKDPRIRVVRQVFVVWSTLGRCGPEA